MTTPQHTETEQTTYPNRVRVPRGRVTHAARVSFADSVTTSCGIFYGREIEPRWQADDAEVTCRACIKSEYRREQKDTEQPKTDAVCTDAAGNPFTSHDFTPDGIGPKCRRCAEPQHEVTRSLNLTAAEGDEDVWDEPRAELTGAEVMTLRPGLVVEARTAPTGARVRVRLAEAPTNPAPGIVTLKGADDTEYDVDATSVVLIGVMPRKGDTIHAQAKTYRDGPDGERVEGVSPVMRRKLDRDPWPGGPGNTVVSDGRGLDSVLTSSIVILAHPQDKRTDEQQIARAISLAMPGLDFHTNTTSLAAIRVFAKRAEHEGRDDEAVLARNDDIAEALLAAGFFVARRGVGQAVYAEVDRSGRMSNRGSCELDEHQGPPAPWVAVVTGKNSLDMPYACRACIARRIESERALNDADPERPYLVRMWDEQGRTLKLADDPQALDFIGAVTEAEARIIAEDIVIAGSGLGWLHRGGGRQIVDVARVTIDRALFYRDGELRRVERVIESNGLPEDPQTAELRRAGATLRRWLAAERTDGPAAFAPNSIVRFGPEMIAAFETVRGGEARPELVEAARAINAFEDGAPSGDEVGQLGDVDR